MTTFKKGRVPTMRFPDFTDEWSIVRIDEIGRIIRGASPRPQGDSRYYGGTVPRLMVQDVTRDGKWVTPKIDSLTEAGAKLSRPCVAGTLTIVCSGTVGIVSFLAVDACIHDGFLALIDINESVISKDFLYHRLSTLREQFEKGATHGGVFTNLTTSGIKEFEFECATLPEQRKIAEFLTAVDGRIGQLSQKKALLEDYKKGVMQQLFTQALRFKDDHGNDFPEWEEAEFGKIAKRASEKHNPMTSETEYLSVELESLSQGTGQVLQLFVSTDQKSIKSKFTKGDVLFGKLRPYLRKWLMPTFDGVCSSEIWVLRGRTVTNTYLYHLIQTDEFMKATNVSSGSKMPRADWHHIAAVSFSYPASTDEQTKIANFLTALDRKIESVAQQITHTQAFKKGLLQQMFV